MNAPEAAVGEAFALLRAAVEARFPTLIQEFRPPALSALHPSDSAGMEQLRALWSLTSGQSLDFLGVIGGLQLLGPDECESERGQWREIGVMGEGLDAVVHPAWDASTSLHPEAVRAVYFAMGWYPILKEPMEANYLAVDTVPLPKGRPGQVIVCGRDEDVKCVAARDLATLLCGLASDCVEGDWQLREAVSSRGRTRYVHRAKGRLLDACRGGRFR